jgi:tetratricopeptide (TPR) repeat protein
MKITVRSSLRRFSIFAILMLGIGVLGAFAQGSNTITGVVFGVQRSPVQDANVELLDQFSRLIQRTRTDGSGRYFFSGLPSGTFVVRVIPFETEYLEQEQSVEILNTLSSNPITGESRRGGLSNEVLDFYLKLDKKAASITGVVFAQEIPPEAKKLYDRAVSDLRDKREAEAFAGFKAAIEIFPKYYAALERLGSEYLRLKHYEAAQILLNAAAEVHPKSHRAWYQLAYALNALNHPKEALEAITKAVEIYPRSAHYLLLSGILLQQAKRTTEAEKHLVQAKEFAKGTLPEVHLHLGLIYGTELKRYGDAAKELKQFLKSQVNDNLKDEAKIKEMIKDYEDKARTKASSE